MISLPEFRSQRRDIRRGVIEALQNGGVPPFATFAEDRVFDSRQDAHIVTGSESLPAITVYTDTTKREPINQGRAPFSHTLDIIIEMSLGGAGGEIETDAELEGKLDVFEEQVLAALFDITRPYALAFGKMFKKILGADSLRLANNDGATRLAMRDLMIQVEYDQRCADFTAAFSPLETVWQLNETKGEEVALTHANVGEV